MTLGKNSLSGTCTGLLAGSTGLGGGLDVTTTSTGAPFVSFLPSAPVTSVPEPGTFLLVGLGLAGLVTFKKGHSPTRNGTDL
jgi:hypothetical protein